MVLPVAGMLTGTAWAAAPAYAATCATKIISDFNGDGWADLLVGEPDGAAGGAVRVLYGTPTGLSATGNQIINAVDVLGTGEHQFGYAVATGYFNNDCYADAAVAAPGTSTMKIMWGAATGLHTFYGPELNLRPSTFTDDPLDLQSMGAAVAAGDINHDGIDDLAMGAPDGNGGAGAVAVAYGPFSDEGLGGKQVFNQSTAGVPGGSEKGDGFGVALAFGDFNGDSRDDLAIGSPLETIGAD